METRFIPVSHATRLALLSQPTPVSVTAVDPVPLGKVIFVAGLAIVTGILIYQFVLLPASSNEDEKK